MKCLEHYKSIAGDKGANLKRVSTPFIDEDVETAEEQERNKAKTCAECGVEYWEQWGARQIVKLDKAKSTDTGRVGPTTP